MTSGSHVFFLKKRRYGVYDNGFLFFKKKVFIGLPRKTKKYFGLD